MDLHEQLVPLHPLVGMWRGPASGQYPTISEFSYTEELTFTNIGKPFLAYHQRSWAMDGRPMHVETGYLRHPQPGVIEFVLAQPTGQSELAEGTLTQSDGGFIISLTSRIMNAATAKTVDATAREYRLSGDILETTFAMAAVGQPMSNHLMSRLSRV